MRYDLLVVSAVISAGYFSPACTEIAMTERIIKIHSRTYKGFINAGLSCFFYLQGYCA